MSFPRSAAPLEDVERVLVVTAHPDDVDFGAGGTVASWTKAGIQVEYCIATSGDAGGFDDTPRERMAGLREAEQRAAAEALGVTEVTFLHHPDGLVYVTTDLRRDITRQIRRFRPDRVLTQSPLRNWARLGPSHPDHVRLGEAAYDAVYPDARNPFAHPALLEREGLAAWTVREVWFMGGPDADHAVDITDTFDAKLAALRAHRTQTAQMTDLESMVRGWLTMNAQTAGLPDGCLAEMFTVIRTG
ncbi:MAG TPA: PIG-L deacetylase family protein [Cryptosporangiaceae bacterium]|nr:PIG-L deacetylase family protein [Cryptosporangiaceae bacterium]